MKNPILNFPKRLIVLLVFLSFSFHPSLVLATEECEEEYEENPCNMQCQNIECFLLQQEYECEVESVILPSPGSAPIYCIAPGISGARIYQSRGRVFVTFNILPFQRTHTWDNPEMATNLGHAKVLINGAEPPYVPVRIHATGNPFWPTVQATADITDYLDIMHSLSVEVFHQSEGRNSCSASREVFIPHQIPVEVPGTITAPSGLPFGILPTH